MRKYSILSIASIFSNFLKDEMRKLFKGGNYSRAETIRGNTVVKDSSTDLGVNCKIGQNWPTIKAVCTKISFFFAYLATF